MPFRSVTKQHWSQVRARKLMMEAGDERRRRGISQDELNKKMKYSQSGISYLENGHTTGFALAVFFRYWDALGCDVEIRIVPREEQK